MKSRAQFSGTIIFYGRQLSTHSACPVAYASLGKSSADPTTIGVLPLEDRVAILLDLGL